MCSRWKATQDLLSKDEYVLTDHDEWLHVKRIMHGPVNMFTFEDRYPAPTEPSDKDDNKLLRLAHPLSFLSIAQDERDSVPPYFFEESTQETDAPGAYPFYRVDFSFDGVEKAVEGAKEERPAKKAKPGKKKRRTTFVMKKKPKPKNERTLEKLVSRTQFHTWSSNPG